MLLHATLDSMNILAAIIDPGQGEAPPGSEKIVLLVKWATYIALGVCVAAIVICGAMMGLASRRGEGGQHMAQLGWICAGAVLIGIPSGLVAALV